MNTFFKCFRMFLWLTILTGVIYPILLTVIAQVAMKERADGRIVRSQDKAIGAELIGQKFTSDKYFWGRPSANDYNALASGGSNLSPTSKMLHQLVEERASHYEKGQIQIPSELLFASGSGLDPHITIKAALFQVDRIIKARKLNEKEGRVTLETLIHKNTSKNILSFFGPDYVNVLMLNISLDEATAKHE